MKQSNSILGSWRGRAAVPGLCAPPADQGRREVHRGAGQRREDSAEHRKGPLTEVTSASVFLGVLVGGPGGVLSLIGGVSPQGSPRGQALRELLLRDTSVLH